MGKKARKTICFDTSDPAQNLAFIFLEKIRYHQSEFVTQLIGDFIKSQQIDVDGSYYIIKEKCINYIKGEFSAPIDAVHLESEVLTNLARIESKLDKLSEETRNSNSQKDTRTEAAPKKENLKGQIDPPKNNITRMKTEPELPEQKENNGESLNSMLQSFKMLAEQ